jgi:hypothetical protein
LAIIDGGAPGVDNALAVACMELGVVAEPHVADWKELGNVAGFAGNQVMVKSCVEECTYVQ